MKRMHGGKGVGGEHDNKEAKWIKRQEKTEVHQRFACACVCVRVGSDTEGVCSVESGSGAARVRDNIRVGMAAW